jgi:hypothetical protein
MRGSTVSDPVRVTLLAILEELDHPRTVHRTPTPAPALELCELEERLSDFRPVESGSVQVALALGLLVRSGLVQARGTGPGAWQPQRAAHQLYQITPEGRKYLVEGLATAKALS